MRGCRQATITDAALTHLRGIHTFDMSWCRQATITDAAFTHLHGHPHAGHERLRPDDHHCGVPRAPAAGGHPQGCTCSRRGACMAPRWCALTPASAESTHCAGHARRSAAATVRPRARARAADLVLPRVVYTVLYQQRDRMNDPPRRARPAGTPVKRGVPRARVAVGARRTERASAARAHLSESSRQRRRRRAPPRAAAAAAACASRPREHGRPGAHTT